MCDEYIYTVLILLISFSQGFEFIVNKGSLVFRHFDGVVFQSQRRALLGFNFLILGDEFRCPDPFAQNFALQKALEVIFNLPFRLSKQESGIAWPKQQQAFCRTPHCNRQPEPRIWPICSRWLCTPHGLPSLINSGEAPSKQHASKY